ncbi:hypothetical protein MNEG_2546 [Monoraphidium neglectum]|uniref:Calcineurin-like phosphoesterase domain-containing protein n=1 Tax=Monoraphidium neglectum TaxID=145388 RepID=A0A0D2NKV0_9CHLO|nr:hypothetical protein MNEG_2546 [Monoraphidium neglectum]KIZ05411.1 hypothetical protein MNEG_2546 [Monoraphidium neglectum]|eukprot:XP_013904430.1 hypothetical protein MNEG_2546 [Monoraphidium neglectum]
MAWAEAPLFTFAVLSDIQYADKEDGHFDGRTQRFRQVPAKLKGVVDAILTEHTRLLQRGGGSGGDSGGGAAAGLDGAASGGGADGGSSDGGGGAPAGGLVAALHLGDIIDGYGPDDPDHDLKSRRDLDLILAQLDRLPAAGVPLRHVLGNHCFAVPRAELLGRLGFPQGSSGYYSARLAPGWRLLVLDTTDISLFGHEEGSPEAAEAAAWLAAHPTPAHPNAQPWNGGVGAAQAAWLRAQLDDVAAEGGRVVVAAHHPLAPGAAPDAYLGWGHAELRAAFEERPGVVALVLAGHYHPGGAAEVGGLHYVTCEGLLEAPPGSDAYAFVDVYHDRLSLRGRGCAASHELPLPPRPAAAAAAAAEGKERRG